MVSKELIIKNIDDAVYKCSTILKSSPYYSIALEMCDKYGLELKRCNDSELRFVDKGHVNPLNDDIIETELRFDDFFKEHNNEHINFENSYVEDWEGYPPLDDTYNLDDVLGMYYTMPNSLKSATAMIVFSGDSFEPNHSNIYSPKYHRQNVITLNSTAFRRYMSDGAYFNLERIMAHEMGHCFEFGKLTPTEKGVVKRLINRTATDKDRSIYSESIEPKMHTYSREGGEFYKIVEEQADGWGLDMTMDSGYALKFFMENESHPNRYLGEHFAETVSIVAFKNKEDKSNARLRRGLYKDEMDIISYDDLKNGKKVLFEGTEKLLGI